MKIPFQFPTRHLSWGGAILALLAVGGCPQQPADNPVSAVLSITATTGELPLLVAVSGLSSSSSAAPIATYHWDFAGLGTSDLPETTFAFTTPGLHPVTLTVTDEDGNVGAARVDVKIAGQPPTARILADSTTGTAPMLVHFDGSTSSAPDDTILDYFWNFDDGTTSRDRAPQHVFTNPGTYSVELRVVTGGGAENTTHLVVQVNPHP